MRQEERGTGRKGVVEERRGETREGEGEGKRQVLAFAPHLLLGLISASFSSSAEE